ncbi:GntR family transcriptional regulator [Bacillus sp. HMF5848]|uniref:GntR family transcriptional regulator n=1 Tax=Bacillus sp. HMF5848 TaxID=2495421 RepID=UPI000F782634|nr:GntR family transcriptional regulator [Bacillus sp. HMF5848]RSK26749.1 GntR family transcriptional regulator [Bacillus sp. HMF5848]
MINKKSPLPIYYQLEELIKQQIENGELTPGTMLPSERELSDIYNISRMTVRQAITNLVNQGFLYREQGRGTFVIEKKFEQDLLGLSSFSEQMLQRGLKPGSILLSFKTLHVSEDICAKLQINTENEVHRIERVRLANEQPIALETTYIPAALLPQLSEQVLQDSLYKYVEAQLNQSIHFARQTLEAVIATDFEIKHLQLAKSDPILLIERIAYLDDGTPFEVTKSAFRADKYKFTIDIKRTV